MSIYSSPKSEGGAPRIPMAEFDKLFERIDGVLDENTQPPDLRDFQENGDPPADEGSAT